jgi:alpha-L-rhamnosidase
VLDQAWFCLALEGAANLARLDGKADEAAQYEQTRSNIAAAVNRLIWNGTAYRSPDYKGATDDRANALCVVAGIAGPEKFSALQKVLATEYHASPYMEKYVLEALMLMRAPEAAQARMKKRYAGIVADQWTTLPELWVSGTQLTGNLSSTRNHAWSGGPLTILSQYFAGLAPLAPGWTNYQVRPQLGSLTNVAVSVDSVAGKINVTLHQERHAFTLKLDSPAGTVSQVYLPTGSATPQRVKANGRVIWENGRARREVRGVSVKELADGYLHLEVRPGKWNLICQF